MSSREDGWPVKDEPELNMEDTVTIVQWIDWARTKIAGLTQRLSEANHEKASKDATIEELKLVISGLEAEKRLRKSVVVREPGEKVKIKESGVEATIQRVIVTRATVMYGVYWWKDKERKMAAVNDSEILDEDLLPMPKV